MTFSVKQIDKGGYYMKGFKKLAAGFLGAVMALGVCGFTALAADGNVAKIGKTEYKTLALAIEAAETDDTIELIANTTENITIESGKDITIDLGEFKITNSSGNTITNKGTLTIEGNGTVDNVTHGRAAIWNEGTMIIDGGSYTRSQENGKSNSKGDDEGLNSYYVILNRGKMTINDAKVEAEGGYSSLIENGWYDGKDNNVGSDSVLIIYDGHFSGGLNTVKNDEYGKLEIKDGEFRNLTQATVQNWNVATINGGDFDADAPYSILTGAYEDTDYVVGKTTINGGTFKSKDVCIAQCVSGSTYSPTSIEINGGTFESDKGEVFDSDIKQNVEGKKLTLSITNGSFTSDVSAYLAEGSHLVEIDGEYVVMDEDEYDDYLDDKRDSGRHSYSLKEGKTERDDEEEEPVVTPEPEEEEGPFSDVGKDNPNYDAIVEVYEKGWMAGIGDGVFAPNGTLTRGMAVTILWNRAGQPEPVNVAPFLDVTSDAWYAKAVAWAYENGITSGYGDTYGPDDFITTEQFTRMNDIANGRTPEVYVGGAPYATRGWVAGMLVME